MKKWKIAKTYFQELSVLRLYRIGYMIKSSRNVFAFFFNHFFYHNPFSISQPAQVEYISGFSNSVIWSINGEMDGKKLQGSQNQKWIGPLINETDVPSVKAKMTLVVF